MACAVAPFMVAFPAMFGVAGMPGHTVSKAVLLRLLMVASLMVLAMVLGGIWAGIYEDRRAASTQASAEVTTGVAKRGGMDGPRENRMDCPVGTGSLPLSLFYLAVIANSCCAAVPVVAVLMYWGW